MGFDTVKSGNPPAENGKPRKPFRILALDGGGARGILQAALIQRIQVEYPDLLKNVDMFTGTSAGSLNAASLAVGKSPESVVEIWKTEASVVFPKSLWRKFRSLNYILEAAYPNDSLRQMVHEQVGQTTLGDIQKKILIPAFNLDPNDDNNGGNIPEPPGGSGMSYNAISGLTCFAANPIECPFLSLTPGPSPFPKDRRWFPEYFHNFPGSTNINTTLADACVRSAAAPTYFPIYQGFIDGGVFANNPSLAAITSCICEGIDLKDICVLSLSTGNNPQFIGRDQYGDGNWGYLKWGLQMIDALMESTSSAATHQAACLLGKQFLRFDPLLPTDIDLDDSKPETLQLMLDLAQQVDLTRVIAWLREYWTVDAAPVAAAPVAAYTPIDVVE